MNTNIKIIHTNNIPRVATEIADRITHKLETGTDVAWFLSGGSNIELAVAIRKSIKLSHSKGALHIFLIDERYGSIGHKHSNWQQLKEKGFQFESCIAHPLLSEGKDPQQLAETYSKLVDTVLDAMHTIALFGIGTDSHTAGLLPFNPLMDGKSYYGSYRAKDFVRVTATPLLIPRLDDTILYAMGQQKEKAIREMLKDGSVDRIPARILKQAKQLTIITDQQIKKEEI